MLTSVFSVLQKNDESTLDKKKFDELFLLSVLEGTNFSFPVNISSNWIIRFTCLDDDEYVVLEEEKDTEKKLDTFFYLSIDEISFKGLVRYKKNKDREIREVKEEVSKIVGKTSIFPIVVAKWGEFITLWKDVVRRAQLPNFFQ